MHLAPWHSACTRNSRRWRCSKVYFTSCAGGHAQAGDFHRSIGRSREALRIWQATLPPSHPNSLLGACTSLS